MTESKYWSLKPFYSKLAITSNEKKIIIMIEAIKIIEKIIYTVIYRPYDWKSNILLYYININ